MSAEFSDLDDPSFLSEPEEEVILEKFEGLDKLVQRARELLGQARVEINYLDAQRKSENFVQDN